VATLGIVGGLGPESTIDYYRRILEGWKRHDPGSSPSILIDSLDVDLGLRLVEHDRPALIEYLSESLARLAAAGTDFAAMAANTPHRS
jgi:aspartate racemase